MPTDDDEEEATICAVARDETDWLSCWCQFLTDHDGEHRCLCGRWFE